ncbi:MAG: hypothetical protein M9913_11655 [Bryobacteraceae bacterium]|nr:hypothetical protein [Bryobacteraceae bacterium]
MSPLSRRSFSLAAAGALAAPLAAQIPGHRPVGSPGVDVLNPGTRVPVSLIIDDSTCLVNMAHFGIPHFAEIFPDRYKQDWRSLPREIPDSFVRKFGEWSRDHGVKGKYSIVPYPACTGWVDRDIPGWSKRELDDSLRLVRDLLLPDWDIHPEMVSHTWVIDIKTGRPYPDRTEHFVEIFRWTDGKSADQLAAYLAYALRILKNAGLPCEGITTPGGFASRVLPELAQATLQSCRDVFRAEIPHYFRHAFSDHRSVAPRVEYASGLDTSDPRCVVSIIACTSDWFGGWDGLVPCQLDKMITADSRGGRLPEVIRRGEPAILYCHWPGIYCNGSETGFHVFQETVRRLHAGHDNLRWMKLSDISRYWAAKELTTITHAPSASAVDFQAPFACPQFTVRVPVPPTAVPRFHHNGVSTPLREVADPLRLAGGTWTRDANSTIATFDLPRGPSRLEW